jgi:hypothetical protein
MNIFFVVSLNNYNFCKKNHDTNSVQRFYCCHNFTLKQWKYICIAIHFFLDYGIIVVVTPCFKEKSKIIFVRQCKNNVFFFKSNNVPVVSFFWQIIFKLLQCRWISSDGRNFYPIRNFLIAKRINNSCEFLYLL